MLIRNGYDFYLNFNNINARSREYMMDIFVIIILGDEAYAQVRLNVPFQGIAWAWGYSI